MSKLLYEGEIGSHSFQMFKPDVIEVWEDYENENPDTYIFVKEGSITSEKDFHSEISYWYMNNVGN